MSIKNSFYPHPRKLLWLGGGLVVSSFFLSPFTQWGSSDSLAALVPREPIYKQPPALLTPRHDQVESALATIYMDIAAGNTKEALRRTDALLSEHPNFKLGHLIRGDLLLSRARPITTIGASSDLSPELVSGLRAEAVKRMQALRNPPPKDAVPSFALKLRDNQKHLLVADMGRSRLYLFEHNQGQLKLMDDQYITQGKQGYGKEREGDQRTPIGLYQTTSLIPDEKLDDFYGAGALPIDYPNDFDKRLGRTGSGIWLHGVPTGTYSRAPLASDGCVVLPNSQMTKLMQTIAPHGTPVLISKKIDWVSPTQVEKERDALKDAVETWRKDWESGEHSRYASHYDKEFTSERMSLNRWLARKKMVNQNKSWIKIKLDDWSIFQYPGQENVAVIEFTQNYASSNLSSVSRKRMYWIKRGDKWKILIEAIA
jgi:murein L,D-transpeptidase YafK